MQSGRTRKRHTWNGHPVPDNATLGELSEMLAHEPPAPWVAIQALAERGDMPSLGMLIEQTLSQDLHRRRAAAEAIGAHQRGAEAIDSIRRLLWDGSPQVVRAAMETTSRWKDYESHERILGLLRDRDPSTRLTALSAIDGIWRDQDFGEIAEIAIKDPDEKTRRQANAVLMDHASHATWRTLTMVWKEAGLPRERMWACQLVERYGAPSDIRVVSDLMGDPDGHVRKAAARAVAVLEQGGQHPGGR